MNLMSMHARALEGLRNQLDGLHRHLQGGNADARDEIVRCVLPLLVGELSRRWPDIDDATINDASEDALLTYLKRPTAYDALRSPLDRYLALVATNHLKDALRRRDRRLRHEISVGTDFPDVMLDDLVVPTRWRDLRAVLRAGRTKKERDFLHARLRGERHLLVLARILGLDDLSVAAKKVEVGRTWMRLLSRIRRARARHAHSCAGRARKSVRASYDV
jgi:DNA-directed RNA polymerase specialized sigma24 family protein